MEAGEILLKKGLLDQRQLELAAQCPGRGARARSGGRATWASSPRRRRCGPWAKRSAWSSSIWPRPRSISSLLQNFPPKFIHREALFPVRQTNGTLVVATSDPFNLYPLDELSAATGLTDRAGAGQRERDRQADQDAPGRGQRDDRRPAGPDGRRPRRAARRDRGRRLRALGDGPGAVGRPAGQRDPARGDRAAGERRAHRVAAVGPASPLPHRRRAARRSRCRRRSTAFRRRSSAA